MFFFVVRSGLSSQAFALMQTCLRAAPSVTACAVPPSSGRKALVFRAVQLVSPLGRDVAQRQRGLAPSLRELDLPQAKTEGAANYLSRIRLTLMQTCQRAAPSVTACAVPPSSGRKAFLALSVCLRRHLSRRERREKVCATECNFTQRPNLPLPLGEVSRSDGEGWLLL